jgi:hypothetical protein
MSVYKRRYGDHAELETLSTKQYQLAVVHAQSLNFAVSVLNRRVHDFESCRCCIEQSAEFRAVVALNLNEEVKSYAC